MAQRKLKRVAEFGDFQTPDVLARHVLSHLRAMGLSPASIIEPSCGQGAFLAAAAETFPHAKLFGLDINADYLSLARERLAGRQGLTLAHESFFSHDWAAVVAAAPAPLLILGNPPWVTNAELGVLGSDNLPTKSNFQNMKGFEAVTGKSNFDISEWMLLQNIEWLRAKGGSLAVLCKTAVARKIVVAAWRRGIPIADTRIYRIDALSNFGAAVEACLLVIQMDGKTSCTECAVFPTLDSPAPSSRIGFVDHVLVSDVERYQQYRNLRGISKAYTWRSGIKHDCAKIMELERTSEGLVNRLGQIVDIEDTYLYPLIKSSDIAGTRQRARKKFVIVPQRTIGENTRPIEKHAPRTWAYLQTHHAAFQKRSSIIYRNKPDFSVFGVGDYSFAPAKVAISGLYKKLAFRLYGGETIKPVFFDDTVYFLPFDSRDEAKSVFEMLNSAPAQNFLESMVFWDEKRPITVDLLMRIDIGKLATLLGRSHELSTTHVEGTSARATNAQPSLFA